MKISLAQALKIKSRLIGELNKKQAIIKRENVRRSDHKYETNLEQVLADIYELTKKLVAIKTAIAIANAPIYSRIVSIAEAKSYIEFLSSLRIEDGVEQIGFGEKAKEVTNTSFINESKRDSIIEVNQRQIENLQDEIDAFNATTFIEI